MKLSVTAAASIGLTIALFSTAPRADAAPLPPGALNKKPALVLMIVVDQFRGDAVTRHRPRLLPVGDNHRPGGFRWLMHNGAWFPQAEHDTLHTMTGPGHATISTGAWPYRHGIVLNSWLAKQGKGTRYCVRDWKNPLIGARKFDARRGISPHMLLGSTFGDALKGGGGGGRVVAVAIKDRAAVLLGGHRANLAIWLERSTQRWITSRYYRKDGKLPGWLKQLNTRNNAAIKKPGTWAPLGQKDGMSEPHATGKLGAKSATRFAEWGPHGDRLTTGAAIAAIKHMKLGQRGTTDLLAVSLSAHDFVGHTHGHNSREMEEMLVSADQALAALLGAIANQVPGGLSNTLVVLTGDHGAPPAQSYLAKHKMPNGIVKRGTVARLAESAIERVHGKSPTGRWVAHETKFEVFLDRAAARKAMVKISALQLLVAEAMRKHPAIQWVFTRDDAMAGRFPPGRFGSQAQRGWHPRRSGDVIGIPRAFIIPSGVEVSHYTGYAYDRTVPIMLFGANIAPGVYGTVAKTVDIAPTLAFLLGVVPPALSEGRVLHEALGASSHPGAGHAKSRRKRKR
jgi:hypothetical protein